MPYGWVSAGPCRNTGLSQWRECCNRSLLACEKQLYMYSTARHPCPMAKFQQALVATLDSRSEGILGKGTHAKHCIACGNSRPAAPTPVSRWGRHSSYLKSRCGHLARRCRGLALQYSAGSRATRSLCLQALDGRQMPRFKYIYFMLCGCMRSSIMVTGMQLNNATASSVLVKVWAPSFHI